MCAITSGINISVPNNITDTNIFHLVFLTPGTCLHQAKILDLLCPCSRPGKNESGYQCGHTSPVLRPSCNRVARCPPNVARCFPWGLSDPKTGQRFCTQLPIQAGPKRFGCPSVNKLNGDCAEVWEQQCGRYIFTLTEQFLHRFGTDSLPYDPRLQFGNGRRPKTIPTGNLWGITLSSDPRQFSNIQSDHATYGHRSKKHTLALFL